jgi:hypothetical protein
MKKLFFALAAPLLVLPSLALAQGPAGLFESGRIRLVEEARITDENLPENALFQNPRCLAMDGKGNVYVSDFDANHIKVFGPDGKFRTTIGRKGQGPGEFLWPANVEISGDRLVVWEAMNRRFSILDLRGEFIKSAPAVHGGQGELMALRALSGGRFAAFIERGLSPQFQGRLPEERDYALLLLSADLAPVRTIFEQKIRNRRWTRHPETQGLLQVGFPYHPRINADVSPEGTLAVGPAETYEIGIYDPDKGRLASIIRPFTPIKLEERDKQAHFGIYKMTVFTEGKKTVVAKVPDYVVKNTEFPEFLPPYRGLIYDGRGRLWVQVFTAERKTNVFDVFSAKGEFLNRVIVDGASIDASFATAFEKRFTGDVLWKIEKNEEGFASLVKYRLTPGK